TRCGSLPENEKSLMRNDPHSFSRPDKVTVAHLSWKATVDFETKTIAAIASWTIKNPKGAGTLILDTKNLDIQEVTLNEDQPAKYRLGSIDDILGQSLSIDVAPDTRSV